MFCQPHEPRGTSSGNCERDENLHDSRMSIATAASPKPSFRPPWRVGNAVVSRGNAGWTKSKSGRPCPCQNCSQQPPTKTGRGCLLNRTSCPPDDPIAQGTELKIGLLFQLHKRVRSRSRRPRTRKLKSLFVESPELSVILGLCQKYNFGCFTCCQVICTSDSSFPG